MTTPTTDPTPTRPSAADRDGPSGRLTTGMARLGSRRVWTASAAVFLVFAGVFFATSAPFSIPRVEAACGAAPLDVRPFSTAGDVADFLDACGADGRAAYRNLQLADLAYPAVFGLFMASSLALVLTRLLPRHPGAVALAVLPLIAAAFDYVENVLAWLALAAYPEPAPTDGLLGLASAAKTTISWIAGVLLVAGLLALGVRTVRGRIGAGSARPSGLRPLGGGASSERRTRVDAAGTCHFPRR